MNKMHNTPIILYIVGVGRSGSTLLDRLLGSIEGFHSCGEVFELWRRVINHKAPCSCGQYAEECPFWSAVLKKTLWNTENDLRTRIQDFAGQFYSTITKRNLGNLLFPRLRSRDFRRRIANIEGVIQRLYQAIAELSGARVIVDSSKSPYYAWLLSEIGAIDLYLVHIVRDSRAVVYSHIRRRFVPEIGYTTTRNPLLIALACNLHNFLAERLQAKHRYVRIRYEDLATHPRETILYIVETLGLVEKAGLDKTKLFTYFSGENQVVLERGHLIAGNAMRFKHGRIQIKLDTEWTNSLPILYKLTTTLITAPVLKRYGYNIGWSANYEN